MGVTGISIPKNLNVQPRYSKFKVSSHTNLDNIYVKIDINLIQLNSSVLEITIGYYSNTKLLSRQVNKLVSKFSLNLELLGGLIKISNNSDRNIVIEFEYEIYGIFGCRK